MLRCLIAILCLCALPSWAAELRPPTRVEPFGRDIAQIPHYQAGYVFSIDASQTLFWVDDAAGNAVVEKALILPDSFRIMVTDVAVSFDGRIAATASAMDREGRFASFIAWLTLEGSLIRVVRTSPFGPRFLGFTEDGSLWAAGYMKKNDKEEEPVYDVLRQYDTDGKLVRTLLPRLSLSTDLLPPTSEGFLLTSRRHVAFVSTWAHKWAVLSSDGNLLSQGTLAPPPSGIEIVAGAITDSGRLILGGQSIGSRQKVDPQTPVFEVDKASGALELIDSTDNLPDGTFVLLMGCDGEDLVFRVFHPNQAHQLIWAEVR